MLLRVLALLALTAPWAAASAVLHPVSAGYLSGYPDGFIMGPNVPPDAGDAPRVLAGRAGVGGDPLTASEARAVFKFDVSSVTDIDDLKIKVRNWGTYNAPGLVAGCFRISICPPLTSYSLFAGAGTENKITFSDYFIRRLLYETPTSPGTVHSASLLPLMTDLARPSTLTFVVVPGSEGGGFFEAQLSGTNEPSPVPVPAGWLTLISALTSAALWNALRRAGIRAP